MKKKNNDQLSKFQEDPNESEMDDSESAFWDEFYSLEKKDTQIITVEELEDQTILKVETKIARLKTN